MPRRTSAASSPDVTVPRRPSPAVPADPAGRAPATGTRVRRSCSTPPCALVPPSATATGARASRFAASGADARARGIAGRLSGRTRRPRASSGRPSGAAWHAGSSRRRLGLRYVDAGLHGEASIPLAELEGLRTDLLSTIAHELRTPLTAVRTSVGLLLDPTAEPTEEQRRALLEAIERNGERMQRLVGDILELSRFRSGSVSLQLRRFERRARSPTRRSPSIAPLAAQRRSASKARFPASRRPRVYGDHRRLEQALLNLVSNAQRFAPDGGTVMVARGGARAHDVAGASPTMDPVSPRWTRPACSSGSSSAATTGSGRGRALGWACPTALAIAQAHGGHDRRP